MCLNDRTCFRHYVLRDAYSRGDYARGGIDMTQAADNLELMISMTAGGFLLFAIWFVWARIGFRGD